MLGQIIAFCTSYQGLFWIALASDLAIALAYFAIPLTMLVVLRRRAQDIPYPWLWTLFVTFIVACGLTHLVHVWSAFLGADQIWLRAAIGTLTAIASVGTAAAFSYILPEINALPSPREQKQRLEEQVRARTKEKDRLIREINHRLGNQLQILSSLVSIELRRSAEKETIVVLERLKSELAAMGARHRALSLQDYLHAAEMDRAAGLERAQAAHEADYVYELTGAPDDAQTGEVLRNPGLTR